MKDGLKVVGGDGAYIVPSNVRVATGAFFDLGFESEKKLGIFAGVTSFVLQLTIPNTRLFRIINTSTCLASLYQSIAFTH